MQVTPKAEAALHKRLPIDADEKILAVYKHHWFAYAASCMIGISVAAIIVVLAVALTTTSGVDSTFVQYKSQIIAAASAFSLLILAGTAIPVYLRSQEQVVLTEEALVQVLRPTLFANKIDQLSLRHIADVSVTQDFLGTMFGFGHITIETPGEQDNYRFSMLTDPHESARQIIAAHENFDAALHSGRMPSSLERVAQPIPQMPAIDPAQYQQFLQYQQMVARQQQEQQFGNVQSATQPNVAQQNGAPTEAAQPPQDPTGGQRPY